MNAQKQIQALLDTLTAALVDAEKFDNGNSAAGTRLRKTAQDTKGALQNMRVYVSEAKTARKV